MNKIKLILLVAVIAFSSVLSASTNPIEKAENGVISKEIGKLLKNPSFEVTQDVLASVRLVVNKNNEIVVLSVDSESTKVINYIKSRLNYNKLSVDVDEKTYIVPVRIVQGED